MGLGRQFELWVRLIVAALALFAVAPAQAAPTPVTPGALCVLNSTSPLDPGALFDHPTAVVLTVHALQPKHW